MSGLNEHANQTVRVSISSPSSTDSRDDGYVHLYVEDEASGEILVSVEIPAGRWWRLCQSSTQTWPAFVSTRLERLGKTLKVTSADIPGGRGDEAEVLAAATEAAPPGCEVSVRRTNRGWQAIYREWSA